MKRGTWLTEHDDWVYILLLTVMKRTGCMFHSEPNVDRADKYTTMLGSGVVLVILSSWFQKHGSVVRDRSKHCEGCRPVHRHTDRNQRKTRPSERLGCKL